MCPDHFRTFDEAYSVAANASGLRLGVREGAAYTNADVLIAAGWSRARVGGALLRLRSECDAVGLRNPQARTLPHLRALPEVRAHLIAQAHRWRMDPAEAIAIATAVLAWWLQPVCAACQGRRFERAAGTARLSSRGCKSCGATGLSRVPHGEPGRRIANYIDDCVQRAQQSIANRLRAR